MEGLTRGLTPAPGVTSSTVSPLPRRAFPLLLAICLALIAAACTPGGADDEAVDETTTTLEPLRPSTTLPPAPTVPPLDETEIEALATLPGRLVFTLGSSIGLMNPNGSSAGLIGGAARSAATQPVFSNEGNLLAWSLFTPEGSSIEVFDQESGTSVLSPLDGAGAFYLQWDGRDTGVGYLQNSPSGGGLEAGFAAVGSPAQPLDTGAPYFFHWNPGQRLWVSHVGDEVRIVDEVDTQTLDLPFRNFAAPMWLDEERVLLGGDGGLLVVDLVNGGSTEFAVPPGDLNFVASPDGTQVAYVEPASPDQLSESDEPPTDSEDDGVDGGDPEAGTDETAPQTPPRPSPQLVVLDLETGEKQMVTEERVFAFEWSPDSTRLAWMGLDMADAANLGEWHFWTEGAEYAVSPSYRPSDLYLGSYLPFFAQYALSHSSWAPDGSGFVFAGSFRGETGIFVQVLPDPNDPSVVSTEPLLVGRGEISFWSPDDAPIGGGGGGSIA